MDSASFSHQVLSPRETNPNSRVGCVEAGEWISQHGHLRTGAATNLRDHDIVKMNFTRMVHKSESPPSVSVIAQLLPHPKQCFFAQFLGSPSHCIRELHCSSSPSGPRYFIYNGTSVLLTSGILLASTRRQLLTRCVAEKQF